MPLRLSIGLSRKVGEANYGSRGANINVEVEIESTLVADPVRFQKRIRELFGQVRDSLAEELNGAGPSSGKGDGNSHPRSDAQNSQHFDRVNGHQSNGKTPRPATPSQVKAIYAITRSRRLDLSHTLRPRFQTDRPENLTLQQASQIIDDLKSANGSWTPSDAARAT